MIYTFRHENMNKNYRCVQCAMYTPTRIRHIWRTGMDDSNKYGETELKPNGYILNIYVDLFLFVLSGFQHQRSNQSSLCHCVYFPIECIC